jgi:osmoprotectant transport system substrate-binding protein
VSLAGSGQYSRLTSVAARTLGLRGTHREVTQMRLPRMLALGASALVLVSACATGGGSSSQSIAGATGTPSATIAPTPAATTAPKPTVRIGSDGFYEAKLMAEIYAQALEAKGYTVDRTAIGLGTRKVTAAALESGQFDLKPEYIGSGLAFYSGKATGDPAANAAALQTILTGKGGGITVLDYSPAADQNAFVVIKATATKYNLSKMSDLTAVQSQLKFGVATDCATNPVCAAALKSAYGLSLASALPLSACDQPMVDALKAGTITVGELCSTQPDIAQNGWVVLTDDKQTQPADNIAPLVRNDLLAKLDKASFEQILNAVSAKMTTDELTKLNAQFVFDKQDIATIAKGWLTANGLN